VLQPAADIYMLQARILKTLASPRRLEIVHLLGEQGPMEVRRIAAHFGTTQPAISQHLGAMRSAGLVEAVRNGREVRYQLADPELVGACLAMREILVRRMAKMGHLAAEYTDNEGGASRVAASG
jgi:ArsR family transcriptional regulator